MDETVIRPWGPQVTPGGLHRGYDWTPEAKVAERTRKLREERGWSQEELGRKLGTYGFAMHQTTVAKLEGAGRPIRLNEVQALANIFGVPPADLFEEDGWLENQHEAAVAAREVQRASAAIAEAEQAVQRAQLQETLARHEVARAASELAERRAAAAAAEARLAAARRG